MNHILLMCAVIPENNKILFHPLSPHSQSDTTGDWALGIGHWALGIGHWALGTADRPKPPTNFPDRSHQLAPTAF